MNGFTKQAFAVAVLACALAATALPARSQDSGGTAKHPEMPKSIVSSLK